MTDEKVPQMVDFDQWERRTSASLEVDWPEVWERDDFHGSTTDEAAYRHYMAEIGADTFCLCGDTAQMHRWSVLGTPESVCERKNLRSAHGPAFGCACDRFVPSPYKCPICFMSAADPRGALECCLCTECIHPIAAHRERRPGTIVAHSIPCIERWCGCNAFMPLVEAKR